MTLPAGTKLGPYEILALLGRGGMGEVYRATDRRLDRMVALKVLPQEFLKDADRAARFKREARTLAGLSHPGIALVHSFEEIEGHMVLAMELLEGETLRQTLRRGALPTRKAVAYAIQIAQGLAVAHEKGVVHRDLKPENIFLTSDGRIKILDFGLARSLGSGEVSGISGSLTLPEATSPGAILGTVGYMAPEQVLGQPADARSDIFSFGTVFYEMLSGRRAFMGESAAEKMNAILSLDPPPLYWGTGRSGSPELERIVTRCLEKNPAERFQSMREIAFEFAGTSVSGIGPAMPERRSRKRLYVTGAIAAAFVVVAGVLAVRSRSPSAPSAAPIHSVIPLPAGTRLAGWASPVLALSRDGRKVAFVAETDDGKQQQVYVRHLDRDEIQVVPGSESAEGPVFSADNAWVAFAIDSPRSGQDGQGQQLVKYSLSTGLTQPICDIKDYFGASFGGDGSVLFVAEQPGPLWSVPAGSDRPRAVVEKAQQGGRETLRNFLWPQYLPGGRSALVIDASVFPSGGAAVLDLVTRELTDLGIGTSFARYSSTGHILSLSSDGTLTAAPLDVAARKITGAPVAVLRDVSLSGNAAGVLALSETGSLAYASGYLRGSGREMQRLVQVGRKGDMQPYSFEPDTFGHYARLSPDGHRLAVTTWDGSRWVYDLIRGSRLRLPPGKLFDVDFLAWASDGRRIAFRALTAGEVGYRMYVQKVDASGEPEPLLEGGTEKWPLSWTPDGGALLFASVVGEDAGLWSLPVQTKGRPRRLLAGQIRSASLSPDGRWLAYGSAESGSLEVFVERFPGLGEKSQISAGGGRNPLWSRDGREIFYRNGNRFYVVSVEAAQDFTAALPKLLFENPNIRSYDIAADGQGFVAVYRPPDSGVIRELHLVTNWFTELERLSPGAKPSR